MEEKKLKILAMYLPQFHSIPENDQFWGSGFTDWITVKEAKPLFSGHKQPRVPLMNNYYDLSLVEDVRWQARLANEYGVYGFGIYHYWFNNDKNLLTKPAEIIHDNTDININYFFAWDNISWKRSWSNLKGNDWAPMKDGQSEKKESSSLLIQYELGTEPDWKRHFDYLFNYFVDERYIKIDGKPLFCIYHISDNIIKMCKYWNDLAIDKGLNGIFPVFKSDPIYSMPKEYTDFSYEPINTGWKSLHSRILDNLKLKFNCEQKVHIYDYDKIWKKILRSAQKRSSLRHWHGAFVAYDDTPRRGNRGRIVINGSPTKFENYLRELRDITISQGKQFIFLTAWNEWGEGAFLEPDVDNSYSYLEALKRAML